MPQIIVTADRAATFGEGVVTLRERVNVSDFESEHFAAQLVERLGWAVDDADRAERDSAASSPGGRARERSADAALAPPERERSADAAPAPPEPEPAAAR